MDQIGYYAVECWGGATFDASLRFLKEDWRDWLRERICVSIHFLCRRNDDSHSPLPLLPLIFLINKNFLNAHSKIPGNLKCQPD